MALFRSTRLARTVSHRPALSSGHVRARSNLKIVTGTTASQLILSDGHIRRGVR